MPGAPAPAGRGGPVHPPARAGHRVQVMLDDRRGHLRDLHLLVRGSHPQVRRAGQVRAARARPPREMRHRPVGILAPGQVRARRARLLTRVRACPAAASPGGGVRPGWSSSDGGSEELPEFRDAARSSLASRSSSSPTRAASAAFCAASMRDELALQRDQRITGSIQRPGGHRPPSSGQANSNQADTLKAWRCRLDRSLRCCGKGRLTDPPALISPLPDRAGGPAAPARRPVRPTPHPAAHWLGP